jgi:hypothetical protein
VGVFQKFPGANRAMKASLRSQGVMKRRFSVLSGRNLGNVEVDAGRVVVSL